MITICILYYCLHHDTTYYQVVLLVTFLCEWYCFILVMDGWLTDFDFSVLGTLLRNELDYVFRKGFFSILSPILGVLQHLWCAPLQKIAKNGPKIGGNWKNELAKYAFNSFPNGASLNRKTDPSLFYPKENKYNYVNQIGRQFCKTPKISYMAGFTKIFVFLRTELLGCNRKKAKKIRHIKMYRNQKTCCVRKKSKWNLDDQSLLLQIYSTTYKHIGVY